MAEKIPGDRLVLGLISVVRTLIVELSKRGVLDADDFVYILQQTAATHREAGDPNNLAPAIHALSEHIFSSTVREPRKAPARRPARPRAASSRGTGPSRGRKR
jgi:hypothetical protein